LMMPSFGNFCLRIYSHKISHTVWIVLRIRLHDSALLFDLFAIIVHFIAQNIACAAANRSFVNLCSVGVDARASARLLRRMLGIQGWQLLERLMGAVATRWAPRTFYRVNIATAAPNMITIVTPTIIRDNQELR